MLTADEIGALVGEAAPLLEGARIQDVHQSDDHTVILTLYSGGHGRLFLLFSTAPGFARFHLVPDRPRALPTPPAFSEAARKRLMGSRLKSFRQVSGDRIVELSLSGPGEGGEPSSLLIHEMLGSRSRLILLGSARRVVAVLEPGRGGKAGLSPGDEYRFPAGRPKPALLRELTSNPWRYLEAEASEAHPGFPAPLHLAIGLHQTRGEAEAAGKARRETLRAALRKALERRVRLEEKVASDLRASEGRLKDREKGELLKGALGRIRRGMASIELEDYFQPELPRVEVELDPSLSPVENVERLFKRYRKAERAVPILRERIAAVSAERTRIEGLLALLDQGGETTSLDAIEERARGLLGRALAGARPSRPSPAPSHARAGKAKGGTEGPARSAHEPRRFTSGDGFEILVGKSAEANDHLTFRIARGSDLFLHVSGRPGAHVIVRAVKGKSFPPDTILDAALLALYYGLPERSRGAAGKGPAANVDYAFVKDVKKPKGARPGLVLLRKHKTVRVRLEEARLERLRGNSPGAPN
jgi:predicted ribosome quality control (RQC) complex YloA/Tae2 family protein